MVAQMQYFQATSFGSRFNDINDSGLAVSGGAYFDFPTLTWSPLEPEATESVSINNNGDVAGSMWYDTTLYLFQPGVRCLFMRTLDLSGNVFRRLLLPQRMVAHSQVWVEQDCCDQLIVAARAD